jgi:hypothetical protein
MENAASIIADVTDYAEMCLLSRCLETGCIIPLFHRCSAWMNIENTASSTVAHWAVFTELLPGNALVKSVTILFDEQYKLQSSSKCSFLHLSVISALLNFLKQTDPCPLIWFLLIRRIKKTESEIYL